MAGRNLPLLTVSLTALVLTGTTPRQALPSAPAPEPTRPRAPQAHHAPPTSAGYSNIYPRDYVGPQACAECHEEKYRAWRQHPHSRMNQNARADDVLGDFSGLELSYAGTRARFTREGGDSFMTVEGSGERRRYRVTRTVGSRFTQMYVGVQVEGPEPPGSPLERQEGKLPFGWWIARRRWYPEVYFDSDCPPELDAQGAPTLPVLGTHARASWTRNCIWCHNTYPYLERLRTGRGAPGFPGAEPHLDGLQDEADLEPERLVTLGISCESCHFGGREHVQREREIRFLPQSPELDFPQATPAQVKAARKRPWVINGICAQCHFSRGVSTYPDGSGTWNSREAIDLVGGACAGAIKCTDCHDPHQAGPPGGAPDRPAQLQACLNCHQELADPTRRADHTQHPGSVSCLDCHMPRIVQGLEQVVRTHRIRAAPDPRMLAKGEPNACNLCHLERSLRWTVGALQLGWGRRIELQPEWEPYYGSFDAPVGEVWLRSGHPVTRLVATAAWARSPLGARVLPVIWRQLSDPYAVNRMFALFAVERVLGRTLSPAELDPMAPPAQRRDQLAALRAQLGF